MKFVFVACLACLAYSAFAIVASKSVDRNWNSRVSQAIEALEADFQKSQSQQISLLRVPQSKTINGCIGIPCHIHQTWKSKQLGSLQSQADSWKNKNQDFKYTLYDDADIAAFTKQHFKDSIWTLWNDLKPVEKADAFRYMVVLKLGGYYADVDVTCLEPISSWGVPPTAAMLAGHEFDAEAFAQPCNPEQVEQWFFAAAPGHPVLHKALQLIMQKWKAGQRETLKLTGPCTFTEAVYTFVQGKAPVLDGKQDFPDHQLYGPAGQQIYMLSSGEVAWPGIGSNPNERKLIRHAFQGSWK
eukprot:CAMPEP_0197625934 /NCGR_PEP_ID=MMETSP1338-20131121/5136_1 /TAXON_ID=43686 ORGANISM="Pelagodinium beii, Strain RCC1491" /NCGR_SAMPLE_ID=MMETSP1338 /ASSEMBLY_ACC=CAM_ASM_000754 /LENGTH=298 /DNA_ID=CAMNT_0043196443 /DNA_START=68 /DNA_END=967 /DNA_ORIENTATION=-